MLGLAITRKYFPTVGHTLRPTYTLVWDTILCLLVTQRSLRLILPGGVYPPPHPHQRVDEQPVHDHPQPHHRLPEGEPE